MALIGPAYGSQNPQLSINTRANTNLMALIGIELKTNSIQAQQSSTRTCRYGTPSVPCAFVNGILLAADVLALCYPSFQKAST